VVLTGGVTKIEGLRELAIAVFDNMPVRLAKPSDMGGLFDTLRDPSYSGAVGLIRYAAGEYTRYEIDVNKYMRHSGEELLYSNPPLVEEERKIDLSSHFASQVHSRSNSGITPPKSVPKVESKIYTTPNRPSEEPHPMTKFWNWATQLF
jgi:cell division protein FtsA